MTFLSPVKRGFGDRKAPDKTYPNMTLCKRLLILYRIALRGGYSDAYGGNAWWNIGVTSYWKIRKAIQNA